VPSPPLSPSTAADPSSAAAELAAAVDPQKSPSFRVQMNSLLDLSSHDSGSGVHEQEDDALSLDPVFGDFESANPACAQPPTQPEAPKSPKTPKVPGASPRSRPMSSPADKPPTGPVVLPLPPSAKAGRGVRGASAVGASAVGGGEAAAAGQVDCSVLDVHPTDVRAWELNRPVDLGPSRHASRGSLRPGSRQHAEWAAHSRYSKKQPSPARLSRFWRSPFGACLPSPLSSFLISLSSFFYFRYFFLCAFLPPRTLPLYVCATEKGW
jgi:hypothetical protein